MAGIIGAVAGVFGHPKDGDPMSPEEQLKLDAFERKELKKKLQRRLSKGKPGLGAEDAARLEFLQAKNRARKQQATDTAEKQSKDKEAAQNRANGSGVMSASEAKGRLEARRGSTTPLPGSSGGSSADARRTPSATASSATAARSRLVERGDKLKGAEDKSARLERASMDFEFMCKDLERKGRLG